MIKLVNKYGVECKAWIIQDDVQLFKDLEQEGFELEVNQGDDPRILGTILIGGFPCPLIKGYIIAKSMDGDVDYFINPDLLEKEFVTL